MNTDQEKPNQLSSTALKDLIVEALDDQKALDISVLDVKGLTDITDYMVIATGTSDRHVRAVAENVMEKTREHGEKPIGHEGEDDGEWVLVDFADVIVHVMRLQARELYDLETLWSKKIEKLVEKQRNESIT